MILLLIVVLEELKTIINAASELFSAFNFKQLNVISDKLITKYKRLELGGKKNKSIRNFKAYEPKFKDQKGQK